MREWEWDNKVTVGDYGLAWKKDCNKTLCLWATTIPQHDSFNISCTCPLLLSCFFEMSCFAWFTYVALFDIQSCVSYSHMCKPCSKTLQLTFNLVAYPQTFMVPSGNKVMLCIIQSYDCVNLAPRLCSLPLVTFPQTFMVPSGSWAASIIISLVTVEFTLHYA